MSAQGVTGVAVHCSAWLDASWWVLCWCFAIGTYLVVVVLGALAAGVLGGWIAWWLVPVVEVSWKASKTLVNRSLRPAANPAKKTLAANDAAAPMRNHLTR